MEIGQEQVDGAKAVAREDEEARLAVKFADGAILGGGAFEQAQAGRADRNDAARARRANKKAALRIDVCESVETNAAFIFRGSFARCSCATALACYRNYYFAVAQLGGQRVIVGLLGVRRHVGEDGRLKKCPPKAVPLSAEQHVCPFGNGIRDMIFGFLYGRLVNQRTLCHT